MIVAGTMGVLVFVLAVLGATSGPVFTRALRVWGRRVQAVAGLMIVMVGAALIYSGLNPGVFDRLILN